VYLQESKLSHIRNNHLLQIGLNLSIRLNDDPILKPVVANYDSFLGSGRSSLLRTVKKVTGPRTLTEYCTRLHGAPLFDSLLKNNNHNIANVLYARQSSGPLVRRQAVLSNFYKNINLQRITLGHLSPVYCVLFDRSGKYIVTVSIQQTHNFMS
jgi:bromodomain and WD repeat domain containing protein 1/3